MDHTEHDSGFDEFLRQVVDYGGLDSAALGVARLALNKGRDALSERQRFVLQTEVIDRFSISECKRCSNSIPWSEMFDAATEHGLCNFCWCVSIKDD